MADDTSTRHIAIDALTDMFAEIALTTHDMAALESDCIDLGHECVACALGRALEALDDALMRARGDGLAVHDKRPRTLATEIGDVSFFVRRYRDEFGCDVYLLADRLDIPYGARISPGADEFLTIAASMRSYAAAADLLARHGSRVDASTVMGILRGAGDMCEEEDEAAAESLYGDGVVPQAAHVLEELSMEADGTWFSVQKPKEGEPKRFEVKAICAYAGKEELSGKTRRRETFHHACVGTGEQVWTQAISQMGRSFDLSELKRIHLGADGEPWCRDAERYLPKAEVTVHLDPFHANRAVLSCFFDSEGAWKVIRMLDAGEVDSAVKVLRLCAAFGLAREKQSERVARYLENNADSIGAQGPSLGTIESDNQHLYGARMDSVPCAWSIEGGSDMARIISRRASGRKVPRMTRERSMSQAKREAREKKMLAHFERGCAGRMVESVGKGYLPPHQVDTRRLDGGKAYALYRGMSNMDLGI